MKWNATVRRDASYALRSFRRAPTFVATVVLTIGLGLGLLAAAFTFFDAYILRPLAVRDPYSLFEIGVNARSGRPTTFTSPLAEQLGASGQVFSESFAAGFQPSRQAATFDPVGALRSD